MFIKIYDNYMIRAIKVRMELRKEVEEEDFFDWEAVLTEIDKIRR